MTTTGDQPGAFAASQYIAPAMMRDAFHCPHCGVYTSQRWTSLTVRERSGSAATRVRRCVCFRCDGESFWLAGQAVVDTREDADAPMLWPRASALAPPPHPEMPSGPRADYEEARAIVDRSPRGAAALLRLVVQKLCQELGRPGKDLNTDIKVLVAGGLPVRIQQALDALRVIGNNAVHPLTMDLRDDRATAVSLFEFVNHIVEHEIAAPKRLGDVYGRLPAGAREAIQTRDS